MNKEFAQILNYLLLLPGEKREIVMHAMLEKVNGNHNAAARIAVTCPPPKPTDSPTNFGEWECHGSIWVWVAELGHQA